MIYEHSKIFKTHYLKTVQTNKPRTLKKVSLIKWLHINLIAKSLELPTKEVQNSKPFQEFVGFFLILEMTILVTKA